MKYVINKIKYKFDIWNYHQLLIDHHKKIIITLFPKCMCETTRRYIVSHYSNNTNIWEAAKEYTILYQKIHLYKDYTKIAIIRNPIKRIVSAYVSKFIYPYSHNIFIPQAKEIINHYTKNFNDGISFNQFINYITSYNVNKLNHHWKPYSLMFKKKHFDRFFTVSNNKQLELFLQQLGYFKTLNDVKNNKSFMKKIDIDFKVDNFTFKDFKNQFDVFNETPKYNYFITDENKQKIEALYSSDLALFNQVEKIRL
ncbi:MAG: sulfotransferase family 2 domain-containing protein [Chitinophagales bacterium]|nr:sulfotransferase family 2 domain-containing protein [Chitinophagales bacterium]